MKILECFETLEIDLLKEETTKYEKKFWNWKIVSILKHLKSTKNNI